MTTHELARKLLDGPNVRVTVEGYEGGVDDVREVIKPRTLLLNVSTIRYEGKHMYKLDSDNAEGFTEVEAVHIK